MLKTVDSGRSDEDETPPRDMLVRATLPFEVNRTSEDAMPTLHGVGAIYGEWTEINSRVEGHFMERFASGSFTKTINEGRDRIRCLFHHGQDPSIGYKPLGSITDLSERGQGVEYDVDLFDADYVRALVPGLEAGVYGSSFRFCSSGRSVRRPCASSARHRSRPTSAQAQV
jgi:phage head maturation protease